MKNIMLPANRDEAAVKYRAGAGTFQILNRIQMAGKIKSTRRK
jgi:hypothetical protein